MQYSLRSIFSALSVLLLTAFPAAAQAAQDRDQQIKRLEERLRALTSEAESLRQELEALRGDEPEQDLTQVETVTPEQRQPAAATQPPPADQPPGTLDPQLVPNVVQAGASKVFNPDISVIGNFVGSLGNNPQGEGATADLEEVELAFQAFVDPYAKANFFIALEEEAAEVEEGYITFVTLPHDFTAKVGKMRANFGKANLMHSHQRAWVDVPLVVERFFGEHGLADSGVSVSKLIPNPLNVFVEATGEVFSGNAEGVFEAEERSDLFYLGRLRGYRDITERSNIDIGTTYARGTLGGANQFAGADVTFRYKPLERAIYRSFISRTELLWNDREDQEDSAFGFYTSADYQFSRRWFAGLRLDRADRPDDPLFTDGSASFTLTFWPSEWSQLRAQFRHINFDDTDDDANEVLFQLNFSIGAHGAHTF